MPIDDTDSIGVHYGKPEGPGAPDPDVRALLLAIIRLPKADAAQNLSHLAENIRDWDSFLYLTEEHRVLPMVYARLRESSVAVPAAIEKRLRAGYECNALQCVINAAELIAILTAMERETIPALPYKGIVLAASVYLDLTARPAGDLDLLVHQQHLAQASEVLFARGFSRLTPIHADGTPMIPNLHEYQFERSSDGMQLELRWKLDFGHPGFTRNLGMEWMWPSGGSVNLSGAEVPNLSPELTLLVLCMHGSKHGWRRLVWILDVAQLLLSFPTLDWSEVIREGRKSGLSRTLALGVLLAHRVLGATVPENLLHRFASDSAISTLAQDIEEALFDFSSNVPENRTGYKVQLMEFRDRIRYLFSRTAATQ